ncbi:metalloendopeptidase [Hypoxylon texense]
MLIQTFTASVLAAVASASPLASRQSAGPGDTLQSGWYWIRAVASPNFHKYLQTKPAYAPGTAILENYKTAGQFNVIDGQLVANTGSGSAPLYLHVEKPADLASPPRTLATSFNTTENTFGTFVFQGDALTWSVPDIQRQNLAAWLVCANQALFINTGAYGYQTPSGCADQTSETPTRKTNEMFARNVVRMFQAGRRYVEQRGEPGQQPPAPAPAPEPRYAPIEPLPPVRRQWPEPAAEQQPRPQQPRLDPRLGRIGQPPPAEQPRPRPEPQFAQQQQPAPQFAPQPLNPRLGRIRQWPELVPEPAAEQLRPQPGAQFAPQPALQPQPQPQPIDPRLGRTRQWPVAPEPVANQQPAYQPQPQPAYEPAYQQPPAAEPAAAQPAYQQHPAYHPAYEQVVMGPGRMIPIWPPVAPEAGPRPPPPEEWSRERLVYVVLTRWMWILLATYAWIFVRVVVLTPLVWLAVDFLPPFAAGLRRFARAPDATLRRAAARWRFAAAWRVLGAAARGAAVALYQAAAADARRAVPVALGVWALAVPVAAWALWAYFVLLGGRPGGRREVAGEFGWEEEHAVTRCFEDAGSWTKPRWRHTADDEIVRLADWSIM